MTIKIEERVVSCGKLADKYRIYWIWIKWPMNLNKRPAVDQCLPISRAMQNSCVSVKRDLQIIHSLEIIVIRVIT